MKNMVKAIAFCIVLILFLNRLHDVFAWKDTAGDYYSSMDSFYKLDEDLVDVLFLGSSRCYCSINNSILWEEHGIRSFSMAISGQDIVNSYYCLVEALKTQTPDVVCLELYGAISHGYAIESNIYRNVLGYQMSSNAIEAVYQIAPDRAGELLLRWPIIHTRYKELQREDFESDRPVYLGYYTGFATRPIDELCTYYGTDVEPIGEHEEKWLRKIIALAKENGIELCLFAAPFVSTEEMQKQLNYVGQIAEENHIRMINMSKMQEELELDTQKDFSDWMHANYTGAQKVSTYMGEFLKENYRLTDRRGEAGSELWEEDVLVRRHEYQNQLLLQTDDMQQYLELLAGLEGYTLIIASNGEYEAPDMSFDDYAELFGLEGYYEGSGIWVIENGQKLFQTAGVDVIEHMEVGKRDLVLSNNQGVTGIVLDKKFCNKVFHGINVIVYDNLLEKLVDVVGLDATAQYEMLR